MFNRTIVLNGGLDNFVSELNAVIVGYRLSSGFSDLFDDQICRLRRSLRASVAGSSEVIDNDFTSCDNNHKRK